MVTYKKLLRNISESKSLWKSIKKNINGWIGHMRVA